MSENNTINPATLPTVERAKSLGVKQIEGKEVFITGYTHNRGKPTDFTPAEKISNVDGLTDYYTITTEEHLELEYKDEGLQKIQSWFVTEAIAKQIERIPNYEEALNNGGRIGPVKAVKRKSQKNPAQTYWCLAFENDDDYK